MLNQCSKFLELQGVMLTPKKAFRVIWDYPFGSELYFGSHWRRPFVILVKMSSKRTCICLSQLLSSIDMDNVYFVNCTTVPLTSEKKCDWLVSEGGLLITPEEIESFVRNQFHQLFVCAQKRSGKSRKNNYKYVDFNIYQQEKKIALNGRTSYKTML